MSADVIASGGVVGVGVVPGRAATTGGAVVAAVSAGLVDWQLANVSTNKPASGSRAASEEVKSISGVLKRQSAIASAKDAS